MKKLFNRRERKERKDWLFKLGTQESQEKKILRSCFPDKTKPCIRFSAFSAFFVVKFMISFCTPCLKWKFVLAFKGHNGFNGFLPPYQNKYLKRVVKLTWDLSDLTYPFTGLHLNPPLVTVTQDEFDVDPLTGFPHQ